VTDDWTLPEQPPRPRRRAHLALVCAGLLVAGGVAWALSSLVHHPGAAVTAPDGAGDGVSAAATTPRPTVNPTNGGTNGLGTQDVVAPPGVTPVGTTTPGGPSADPGSGTGRAFLAAWQAGDYAAMQALVSDPRDDLARAYGGLVQRLHLTRITAAPTTYTASGPDQAQQSFHATLSVADLGDVGYDGVVPLAREGDGWRVRFTAATLYPGLLPGQRLDLVSDADPGPRLLDRAGTALEGDEDLSLNLVGAAAAPGRPATGLRRVAAATVPAARPSRSLAVIDAVTGARVSTVRTWPGDPATTVRTTIDLSVQRAAEQALAGQSGAAALVAVDVHTGEVRALANRPTSGLAIALNGSYQPGSTFKIITAAAAIASGAGPDSPVACPATITVGTRTIANHPGESTPAVTTLAAAFARSCNTAFVGLASTLPRSAVHDTASQFGFDTGPPLPIASVGGSAPLPSNQAELAEEAIGQGRVLASPLQMASVAASVADGTWHQPHVLACPTCTQHAVPGAAALRVMMRAVVTDGTATQLAGLPGAPVSGKTGTAEYGTGSPAATHAWFVGWQGDVAFAAFVHDGASGSAAAVPVVERFLRALSR